MRGRGRVRGDVQSFRPHPQVVFTELADGSGVLLHLLTKFFFSLNPTSTFLWKSVKNGGTTRDNLVTRLLEEYRVGAARARRDVEHFVEFLLKEELLIT